MMIAVIIMIIDVATITTISMDVAVHLIILVVEMIYVVLVLESDWVACKTDLASAYAK